MNEIDNIINKSCSRKSSNKKTNFRKINLILKLALKTKNIQFLTALNQTVLEDIKKPF